MSCLRQRICTRGIGAASLCSHTQNPPGETWEDILISLVVALTTNYLLMVIFKQKLLKLTKKNQKLKKGPRGKDNPQMIQHMTYQCRLNFSPVMKNLLQRTESQNTRKTAYRF